ncbi:unnamed protein product [Prunus armeniaca]
MGIFKFPKSFCQKLEHEIARFWWGQKQDEIKVHWISWATLGLPKNQGGMGFRDFNDFNLALLAKQCWGLIMEPNSQWAQLLKARYFPECSFFEAKKGGRASWAWASLLEGRKIILQGARWQILNGRQAKIWTDRWIPSLHDGKLHPHLQAPVDPNTRVETLIDWDSKSWNLTPIQDSITDEEKLVVQLIPIGNGREEDRLVWPGEKNSRFSVRSGYHYIHALQVEVAARKASTSSRIDPLVWKNIWKAEVPPKIKNFLWRATHDRLPTAMALHKRKIARTLLCPICQAHEESIKHLLLFCPWVELIWFGGPLNYKIDKQGITTFDQWLLKCTMDGLQSKEEKKGAYLALLLLLAGLFGNQGTVLSLIDANHNPSWPSKPFFPKWRRWLR